MTVLKESNDKRFRICESDEGTLTAQENVNGRWIVREYLMISGTPMSCRRQWESYLKKYGMEVTGE